MKEYRRNQDYWDQTSGFLSKQRGVGYPLYLDTIKQNLQISLHGYSVLILEKENDQVRDQQDQIGEYSLILTSFKVHREKFQIFTQAFLNQTTYCFYVRHSVTLNNLQLIIPNKQSISMAVSFCNKINQKLDNFKLIIDPPSGKIYFETKSFINQSSIVNLKRIVLRSQCFYTEVIYCSVRKAQAYVDLVLFLLGQITIFDLARNSQLVILFPFLKECQEILQKIHQNIFYIPFLDIDPCKNLGNQDTEEDFDYYTHVNQSSSKQHKKQQEIEQLKTNQQQLAYVKQQILDNSLQFFSKNFQNTLSLYTQKDPYSNVNFSIEPFKFGQKTESLQKSISDIEIKTFSRGKKILTFIQIVQAQSAHLDEDQQTQWKVIYQGGFGIIDTAMIKYINLSASYREPEMGVSVLIKQQLVRKRDKIIKKKKIQRQRNVLERLKYHSHPNIMSFYISFQANYQNCVFSEYTPHMSLDLYLKKNLYSVTFSQKLSLLNQAIQGLIFLHQNNIVHLDIKPGNMLVNKKLVLMLSDFGQAFIIGQNDPITHNHAYTIPYCAPEVFKQQAELTVDADVYAIGACIFKVILGETFLETFLQKRFLQRLREKDIMNLGVLQKYQKSFMYPIFKIIIMIAFKAVHEDKDKRPQLEWIGEILSHCRNFILTLLY